MKALVLAALSAAASGCHPKAQGDDAPAKREGPAMASAEGDWKIVGHVMEPTALIDEKDAAAFNGRSVTVTRTGYASPFHGTCEESSRIRRARAVEDVIVDVGAPRSIATDYDMASPVTDYKLSCRDVQRPALQIFISATPGRAMTCFSGVCYFLRK